MMKSPPRPPHLRPLILLILVLLSSSSTLASAPPVRVPYKQKGETYYKKLYFPSFPTLEQKQKICFYFLLNLFPTLSTSDIRSNSKDSKFSGGIAKLVLFEIRFRNPFPKGGSGMNSKQSWNRARFRPEGRNFLSAKIILRR